MTEVFDSGGFSDEKTKAKTKKRQEVTNRPCLRCGGPKLAGHPTCTRCAREAANRFRARSGRPPIPDPDEPEETE